MVAKSKVVVVNVDVQQMSDKVGIKSIHFISFHDPLSKVWGMVYSYVTLQIKKYPRVG